MSEERPILCFQHCRKDVKVLCFEVPRLCPQCGEDVHSTPMSIPPFKLPCPLMSSKEAPFSVVVKPTSGTFLTDYMNSANLHVGVTDSRGTVYDYDETGLHVSPGGWPTCLVLPLVAKGDTQWTASWDHTLQLYATHQDWIEQRYSEDHHNCYDFVLSFLVYVGMHKKLPCVQDRTDFCAKLVIPKTTQIGKYVTMYRRIQKEGMVMQQAQANASDVLEENTRKNSQTNFPPGAFNKNRTSAYGDHNGSTVTIPRVNIRSSSSNVNHAAPVARVHTDVSQRHDNTAKQRTSVTFQTPEETHKDIEDSVSGKHPHINSRENHSHSSRNPSRGTRMSFVSFLENGNHSENNRSSSAVKYSHDSHRNSSGSQHDSGSAKHGTSRSGSRNKHSTKSGVNSSHKDTNPRSSGHSSGQSASDTSSNEGKVQDPRSYKYYK